MKTVIMTESSFFEKISAYIAENKRKTALEAELSSMTVEAIQKKGEAPSPGIHFIPQPPDDTVQDDKVSSEEVNQRLDAIYDEEPLGFEKDPMASNIKMLAQD